MKRRLLCLALAIMMLFLAACGGETISSPSPEPEETPLPTATPDPRTDWATDLAGVYHQAGDELSLLTLFSTGKTGEEGRATYRATLDLTGLATLEGEGGYDENHIFSFTAADPAGETLTAVVSRDGMDAILTVIDSQWDALSIGTALSFLRNMPPVDPETFTCLLTDYVSYDATQRGAEAHEATALYVLVKYALDNLMAYRDRNQLHTVLHEGYMAMEHGPMLRFDYNLYHGLHQLAARTFADYDEVRDRFAAAGLEEEMELLANSAEAGKNWRSLLNHLVGLGVATLD